MTPAEVAAYYADLLIIQYNGKSRADATVQAFVAPVIADSIVLQVQDAFSVDAAVGKQLDTLAAYVGASRYIFGLVIDKPWFSLPLYGTTDEPAFPGFAAYGDTDIPDYFISYGDLNDPVGTLTDGELRELIRYLAQVNALEVTNESIDAVLLEYFPGTVTVFDNGNMTMTYISPIDTQVPFYTIVNAFNKLPRPAGVLLEAVRSETLDFFFGFQYYNEVEDPVFVGFGLYGADQEGSFIRYP